MKFDINKYLGTWYEIAKIPTKFEPNLTNVTAEYSLLSDGTIQVVNTGYTFNEKVTIKGFAHTTDQENHLKVSFFKGVEADYKVLATIESDISDNYRFVLVGGSSPDYLWLLSRKPEISNATLNFAKSVAKTEGYNVDKLQFTTHTKHD